MLRIPSDWAASVCPSSTEMMPARTISAMYGALVQPEGKHPDKDRVETHEAVAGEGRTEGDPDGDLRVEVGDVVPEEDLDEDRCTAEEPDVKP